MPKAKSFSVIAFNETTSLMERITPSPEVRRRFKDIGKIRHMPKPSYPQPPINRRTLAERLQLQDEVQDHIHALEFLSQTIANRPPSPTPPADPPIPLIQRLYHPYEIPPPIPASLHFRRTKILHRIKEYRPMLVATKARLDMLYNRLQREERLASKGKPVQTNPEIRAYFKVFFETFYELYNNLEEKGHKLTNHQWRDFKGAMKRIGKISFDNIDGPKGIWDICSVIITQDIDWPGM
ncbi:hypothetical protein C8J56DRAFT_369996 [Mycena floridula]|nr:hypothetical protein C8J56DRAFT_369996 [Mycena floridula]